MWIAKLLLPIVSRLCIILKSKAWMGTSRPFETGSESEVRCEADTFKSVENPPGAVNQKSVTDNPLLKVSEPKLFFVIGTG
jgi:hypothetical protein